MRFPSTLDEGTHKAKPLPKSTATHPKDSRGNKQPLNRDLTSTTSDEGTAKTTPPCLLSDDELDKESDEEEVLAAGDDMDEDIQADEEVRTPSPKQDQPEPSQEHHEEAAISYADLKASIDQYYNENIAHRDQTDKLVEAFMSSLDRSNTTISDLYKVLDVITQLLKDINNVVKDDPAANQKINEATETFVRISSNITKVLSLVKGFDFSPLFSTVKDLQAHSLKQDEELAAWAKSSTNMAWTLGSRISGLERAQNHIKSSMSSL
ncbi:hypothetical protein Tco_0975115 [Tanacetum coccineum]|uniref:Uncharacterized protein n=1 Tax=Tanacetum coccineum TaxID=301880 RepID=A0ABQ5EDI0_9ASTR